MHTWGELGRRLSCVHRESALNFRGEKPCKFTLQHNTHTHTHSAKGPLENHQNANGG